MPGQLDRSDSRWSVVVVVTHGGAGDCLLDAVAAILGALPAAVPVSVDGGDLRRLIRPASNGPATRSTHGAGVVLLVDLQGSSPFQACMAMMDGSRAAEVVCGVNLAMLLKLATIDRCDPRPSSWRSCCAMSAGGRSAWDPS